MWWPQDTHLKTKHLSLCLKKLVQPMSTFWSHISAIGNKITETLSSSGVHYVYVWKIKRSTPLPSLLHWKFGCLLFSTRSLNSSTTLHGGVGRGKALFSLFYVGKILERPFRENAATNFVTIVCCGVLLEFTYLWVNLHIGSNWRVKSWMMKIEWKPL